MELKLPKVIIIKGLKEEEKNTNLTRTKENRYLFSHKGNKEICLLLIMHVCEGYNVDTTRLTSHSSVTSIASDINRMERQEAYVIKGITTIGYPNNSLTY